MITVRNEFEPVPAFEHIAGCSLGTWSARETAIEMINILDTVQSHIDTKPLYKDLAGCNGDNIDLIFDIQNEVAEHLNYYMPMEQFCSITLDDGEYRVTPNLEEAKEDCHTFDDIPDKKVPDSHSDFILVVNDHGNVACMQWYGSEYKTIWDMV